VLERRESSNGVVLYVATLLEQVGVPHGFSTRIGGISPAPFDSLNLGNPSGTEIQDDWDRIHENYRRFQTAIGCSRRSRFWVHQVHGGDVIEISHRQKPANGVKADAIVSRDPATAAAVRVADCAPVLMASDDGAVVAAVHCGWRGVVAEVVPKAAEAMKCDASKIVAAIGPCISMEAFEVGLDVLEVFNVIFGSEVPVSRRSDGKGRVDLRASIRCQLNRLGIERIDMTDRCTFLHADEFFSHRRDRGITGRMAAIIGPKPYPWLSNSA
jgi:YfiH family protein